jgi:phosphoribosylformylglycinamidine synthase subunit PurL
VALAECAILRRGRHAGAELDLSDFSAVPLRSLLFGETQGRVIVTTPDSSSVRAVATRHGVPASVIGRVSRGDQLSFTVHGQTWTAPLDRLAAAYHGAIPRVMASAPQSIAVEEQDSVAVL